MNQGTWKHSSKIILLCAIGVGVNLLFSFFAAVFRLPIYLDCIGTILVAILGGTLPAVIVGFISNVISSYEIPLYLYYGIPTLFIAVCAGSYAKLEFFKHMKGRILCVISFALLGGISSTCIGWVLFSQQINGSVASMAFWFNDHGLNTFLSQLFSELIYEIFDKSITVFLVCVCLYFLPKKYFMRKRQEYRHSVNTRLARIVVCSTIFIGILSLSIGVYYYNQLLTQNSLYNSQGTAQKAAQCVNGDLVENHLKYGDKAKGYKETMDKLSNVYKQGSDIRYLYVYVIKKEGCYALYDVDVPGEKGQSAGTFIKNDPDIYERLNEFLLGGEIKAGYRNNPYGTMVSSYTPIHNSKGKTVAYACTDIDLNAYLQKMWVYVIQTATFIFGIILSTIVVMLWFINRHITRPIETIVEETKALDAISPKDWLDSEAWKHRVVIHTGDEIEELYNVITTADENVCMSVRKQLEKDEANRAKTDFLSRMSHDMRTPMNAIIGLSALTIDDAKSPEIVKDNMAKIRSSSDFLLGLVNDILDLAKIEDGAVSLNYEPYTYEEFLVNMRTMFQAQCDAKGIKLFIQDAKVNPMVLTDKMRINQIFFNVFSNAVKYTLTGGKISYTTTYFKTDETHISAEATVEDTGIGMSKEYQEHLFEAFHQESNQITPELQGSGLGLSITKQLVDLMGGTIQIESSQGVGTTVKITLPFECIEKDVKHTQKETSDKDDITSLGGKHVLLAEDHPLNAQIARRILEKKHMMVSHAENGKMVLDMFASSKEYTFDIILMDIRMPVMDGLDATKAIRNLNREDAKTVPIIAMSANAYSEDIKKSLDAGMNGHLAKPVDPQVLYETICENLINKE